MIERAVYRLLLRLYPAEFRRRHGAELDQAFAWSLEAARKRHGRLMAPVLGAIDALRAARAISRRSPVRAGRSRAIGLLHDLRLGGRALRRTPLFSAGLVAVLAIGIGINASVFSLVHAVLIAPLPYADPDRVVLVGHARADDPAMVLYGATPQTLLGLRERASDVIDVAAAKLWTGNLDVQMDLVLADRADRVRAAAVTPNFFEVLGVTAAHGRVFSSADEGAADARPIVVSHDFWLRVLGGRSAAVGESLTLVSGRRNRGPSTMTVIGVLPADVRFTYPEETEIWSLYTWATAAGERPTSILYELTARLRPGVSAAQAEARLAALGPDIGLEGEDLVLTPVADWVAGDERPAMLLLSGIGGLLLALTCTIVASALLMRLGERQHEVALRASLGASRARLIGQVVAEALLLVAAGTASGVGLALVTRPALRSLVPHTVPRGQELDIGWALIAFAAFTAAVVTVLAAVIPAWRAARVDTAEALRRQSRSMSVDRASRRWRQGLVTAQAALASVMLVATVLLVVSFLRLLAVPLGFDVEGVQTVEMRLIGPRYASPADYVAFDDRLRDELRVIPGVAAVGLTSAVPFRGVDWVRQAVVPDAPGRVIAVNERQVDPGYFEVMGITALRGRVLTAADTAGTPVVAVLSESLARWAFGDADPIGRRIESGTLATVVGVVPDLRYESPDRQPRAAIYFSRAQSPTELVCLVIRAHPGAPDLELQIREAVRAVDPTLPPVAYTSIDRLAARLLDERRFYTTAAAVFAGLALLLAASGLVVVAGRSIRERRRELAIRAALGGTPGHLVALVTRQGVGPAVAGAAVGLFGAWLGAGILERFLYDLGGREAWPYVTAGALAVATSLVACLLPARRVTRLAPSSILNTD